MMTMEVTEEELRAFLFSIHKEKIMGPDELSTDFYVGFYDFIKKDLFYVIRESQYIGKVLGQFNLTFLASIPKRQKT